MACDILSQIVEKRKVDIKERGVCLGFDVPSERKRKLHPFVQKKGVILEVKRASPSKKDIAPGLDAVSTALSYQSAGAAAISVLTEENWFKGNLNDLKNVCDSVDIAVLRKDFLIYPDEIDVAYKCGADAVLLIARVLQKELFAKMLERTAFFGMTAFVELRLEEDLKKLLDAKKIAGDKVPQIVCGVNARDLKDFSIDLLSPSGFLPEIKSAMGESCPVVFESGIRTSRAASFAGSLGFTGLLLGEAAARDSSKASELVRAFVDAGETKNSASWSLYSKMARERKSQKKARPFIKICGLTNLDDALFCADLGADFLGFVFCASSPRATDEAFVRSAKSAFLSREKRPCFVGVVTELSSEQGKAALRLASEGVLDFVQLHGKKAAEEFFADPLNMEIPHYCAQNVGSGADLEGLERLASLGEPRVLIDAKAVGSDPAGLGGTGTQVEGKLVLEAKKKAPLWLSGGLSERNVQETIEKYSPELIDASSLLESGPRKKDFQKLRAFFKAASAAALI